MKRGDIWIMSRLGHHRRVVVVGHEAVTATRAGVLVIPISDIVLPTMVMPLVSDEGGEDLGTAQIPNVGEVNKAYFTS
ncbi:hypothetical protein ACWKSP_37765 [Micromonosporaceae bacterium Da 78-11]